MGKEKFFVFTPQGPKAIGYLECINGKITLVKHVSREKHFHRKFVAWGLQAEALPRLRHAGVGAVRLLVDDGSIFQASLDDIERYGFNRQFAGHGEQVFLRELYWRQIQSPVGKRAEQLCLSFNG